jgi:hypothetical protein
MKKYCFRVLFRLFKNYQSKCSRKGTLLDILQKIKTYSIVLPVAIILRLNPIEIPKMYTIEAPNDYTQSRVFAD